MLSNAVIAVVNAVVNAVVIVIVNASVVVVIVVDSIRYLYSAFFHKNQ